MITTNNRLSGYYRWSVLDQDDNVEIQSEWRHNLITNSGMDAIGTSGFPTSSNNPSAPLRSYSAIGEGTNAPTFSDTTLGFEVQRTQDNGGFDGEYIYTNTLDSILYDVKLVHLHTMTTNRNLTEFGYFSSNSGGSCRIRELFRDNLGNPITLTVAQGKKLKLEHRLVMELDFPSVPNVFDWKVEELDASDNLVPGVTSIDNSTPRRVTTAENHGWVTGDKVILENTGVPALNNSFLITVTSNNTFTLNGTSAGTAYSSGAKLSKLYPSQWNYSGDETTNAPVFIRDIWAPNRPFSLGLVWSDPAVQLNRIDNDSDSGAVLVSGSFVNMSLDPYISGSFERTKRMLITEAGYSGPITALGLASITSTTRDSGIFKMLVGGGLTKSGDNTLELVIKSTWARG